MPTTLRRSLAALVLLAFAGLATPRAAHADMVVIYPDLSVVGEPATVSSVPTEVTFVVTNTGRDTETVSGARLVLLADGVRIPLTITRYEVDGVAVGRFDERSLAPGASMRVHVVFTGVSDRGETSWELALSYPGMRAPGTVTIRRG